MRHAVHFDGVSLFIYYYWTWRRFEGGEGGVGSEHAHGVAAQEPFI
jgi:hypothetical protein